MKIVGGYPMPEETDLTALEGINFANEHTTVKVDGKVVGMVTKSMIVNGVLQIEMEMSNDSITARIYPSATGDFTSGDTGSQWSIDD